MYRLYHKVGFLLTGKIAKDQITQISRELRTAISIDGNTPTPQMTDLSLEHWPRGSPPLPTPPSTAADSYLGGIWNTGARGFSQADGHQVLCWLD